MQKKFLPSIASLLAPQAIAVVGASQRGGRGSSVIDNLQKHGYVGQVFAVNPRYDEVLGRKCFHSVAELPDFVDCVAMAVGADAACEALEQAYGRGIRAAIVMSSGFGEGGHGEQRAARLRVLAEQGMSICGPNCYGILNLSIGAAAFSGPLPGSLVRGPVALISQSGGLSQYAFGPLMEDRGIGFSHVVSCGNQIGTLIEDYVEYFTDNPEVSVIAVIFEELKQPRRLLEITRRARERRKTLIFFQAGRSPSGQVMVQSHTGALVGNAVITAAFLRRCGVIHPQSYDEFVETIALLAVAPQDDTLGRDVIVVTGSGGGSALVADALYETGMPLATFPPEIKARIRALLPEFGSVNNPLDATGAIFDDLSLVAKLFDVLLDVPGRPIIAASVASRPGTEPRRRQARSFAEAARSSGRTIVGFQYSPLGGPLDAEIVTTLRNARMPFLVGVASAMRALQHLPARTAIWAQAPAAELVEEAPRVAHSDLVSWDFVTARRALTEFGIPIVEARHVGSEDEAIAAFHSFGGMVAVKAELTGLLHKSDVGCVRLGLGTAAEVAKAYREVISNARQAGYAAARHVLVQPMIDGVAEVFAGIVNDPLYGPTVSFGLGGIFIEILNDSATELAPLALDEARAMIRRTKAAAILGGARGRAPVDLEALADVLVKLGRFAAANYRNFRSLDLNPIIVGNIGDGVVGVDIAVDAGIRGLDCEEVRTRCEAGKLSKDGEEA